MQKSGNGGPAFIVRSPKAVAHALLAPGQLGLGRAYASGDLAVSDLDQVMRLLDEWKPPPIETTDKLKLAGAAARAVGLTAPAAAARRGAEAARRAATRPSATGAPFATTTTSPTTSSRCSSTSR